MTNHEAGIGERPGKPGGNTVGNTLLRLKGLHGHGRLCHLQDFPRQRTGTGPGRSEGGSNWHNFIDALRTRKREDLNAEIEEGAISCALMHLGNIAYRVGRSWNSTQPP